MRSLGADDVIDYTQEDFTGPGETYDVVFDAVGKTSFGRAGGCCGRAGMYVDTDLGPAGRTRSWRCGLGAVSGPPGAVAAAPLHARRTCCWPRSLSRPGEYRAVIDRTYPLDEVVEATRYVETEQKTGNVVLTVTAGR